MFYTDIAALWVSQTADTDKTISVTIQKKCLLTLWFRRLDILFNYAIQALQARYFRLSTILLCDASSIFQVEHYFTTQYMPDISGWAQFTILYMPDISG